MKATCCVGGCEWSIADQSIVELEAFAEVHRATNHDWVKRGRGHRITLEIDEVIEVDRKLEAWEAIRVADERAKMPLKGGILRMLE